MKIDEPALDRTSVVRCSGCNRDRPIRGGITFSSVADFCAECVARGLADEWLAKQQRAEGSAGDSGDKP